MSTREITRMAILAAISIVLSMLIVFRMPQGGSVSLYLVPLFLVGRSEKLRNAILVGIVVGVIQVMMDGFVANPLSPLIDYVIPVTVMTGYMMFRTGNIYVNIIIGCIIALACYTISGMLFWETPFWGSLTYNAGFFVPTVILNLVVFILVKKPILKIMNQEV